MDAIVNYGPFDGVLAFSQGSCLYRIFHAYTQIVNPEPFKEIQLPTFLLSFGGAVFPEYQIKILGKFYDHFDFKHAIDSLHIYGSQDQYLANIEQEPSLFLPGHSGLPPTVVVHDEGHKVPRHYTPEHATIIKEFMKR